MPLTTFNHACMGGGVGGVPRGAKDSFPIEAQETDQETLRPLAPCWLEDGGSGNAPSGKGRLVPWLGVGALGLAGIGDFRGPRKRLGTHPHLNCYDSTPSPLFSVHDLFRLGRVLPSHGHHLFWDELD